MCTCLKKASIWTGIQYSVAFALHLQNSQDTCGASDYRLGNHADVYLFRFLFGLVSGTAHLLFYISGTVKTPPELQTIDEWGNNVDAYLPKKASIWIGIQYSIVLFITLKLHLQRVHREYLLEYNCVSIIH